MRKRGANFKHKNNRLAPRLSIGLQKSLEPTQQMKLGLMGWQALDAIKKGMGDDDWFSCLATSVNLATMLAEKGVGGEYLEYCEKALDAVRRIGERGAKTGRFVGDGEGYQAISLALELYDQQCGSVTQKKLLEAVMAVDNRLTEQKRDASYDNR